MRGAGFAITPLLILRDWYATVQSVLRRDPGRKIHEIEKNMRYTVGYVGNIFADDQLLYVSYEAFCDSADYRNWLFYERLGLDGPKIHIRMGENTKYYLEG